MKKKTGTEVNSKETEKKDEETKRSPGRIVLNVILDVLVVLFVAFAIINLYLGAEMRKNASASLFGKQARLVLTGSMEPTIPKNSLVLIDTSGDKKDYEIGDVLTFNYSPYGELPTTHRVIEKKGSESDTTVTYVLQGDAAGLSATQTITSDAVIGKVVFHSLVLGNIVAFSKGIGGYICFILLPCVLLLAYSIFLIVKALRDNKKEKEKEATAGNAPPVENINELTQNIPTTTSITTSSVSDKDKEIEELRRQIEELKKQKQESTPASVGAPSESVTKKEETPSGNGEVKKDEDKKDNE